MANLQSHTFFFSSPLRIIQTIIIANDVTSTMVQQKTVQSNDDQHFSFT